MATAIMSPAGEMATLSGWPPRSQLATTSLLVRSTLRSTPEGSVKEAEVFTPTKAMSPLTTVVVGSPSMGILPSGFGARASLMSIIPITPSGLSE